MKNNLNQPTDKTPGPPPALAVSIPGSVNLTAIIESSDDAILSKDLNGIIQSWNKGAERIFGYTADEIIGKSVTTLMPEGRRNEEPTILAKIKRGERVDHYETIRQRKDGTLLDISLTVSPIRDASGTIIGASKIARDVTEQKRAQRAVLVAKAELAALNEELEDRVKRRTQSLNEAMAQMEEFSYSVSHDLRSPVRAMRAYAGAVLEDNQSGLNEKSKDHLQRIIRAGARMDKLILDLLTYSRVARDKMEIRPVEMVPLIQDIIQHYPEMQAPQAQITVHGSIPNLMAHEPSLTQAISNLFANAVKFVAPGTMPKVEVRAEQKGDMVRIWVIDNGIGIKREHQTRLFGMFERAHQDTKYEGTGIGLAIVRKAVERMGGKAGMQSENKLGSSFWIELPRAHE